MNIIEAHQISKKYRLCHKKLSTSTSVAESIRHWWNHRQETPEDTAEDFWALKDISFAIEQGQRVGIIGHNGSGKSTLLKILSQITQPTSGQIMIRGRVASLLEVGTGFHPELTGRENIYLNGAILGMRRKEIAQKFDGIVDFAEIEQFLDTPVKHYSSGMYVRLAFAVASHLEPDILIADEVLAVGDINFQKKCIDKMIEIGNTGTTILYVSHNMSSIKNLCDSGIMLSNGCLTLNSDIDSIINSYLNKNQEKMIAPLDQRTDRRGSQLIQFNSISFKNADNEDLIYTTKMKGYIKILISFKVKNEVILNQCLFGISIINQVGEKIAFFYDELSEQQIHLIPGNTKQIEISIPDLTLMPGKYTINLYSKINGEVTDWVLHAGAITIIANDLDKKHLIIPAASHGLCYINHSIKINLASP